MENSFELFIILFLGLLSVIKFKQLGKFTHNQAKGSPSLVPEGWKVLILQAMFLIVGLIFVIVSLLKLISKYF